MYILLFSSKAAVIKEVEKFVKTQKNPCGKPKPNDCSLATQGPRPCYCTYLSLHLRKRLAFRCQAQNPLSVLKDGNAVEGLD